MTRYLADTYAFIEALEGNPRYARIVRGGKVATTALNVAELHYALLRNGLGEPEAQRISRAALGLVAEVPADVAIAAGSTRMAVNTHLRRAGSAARLSHVDAWGYEAARALGLRFLTGDPVFRGMPGVEFVR